MPEIINPTLNLSTSEFEEAAKSIFDNPEIRWGAFNGNAAEGTMSIMGVSGRSSNKVVVQKNSQTAIAVYQDRDGNVIAQGRPLPSVREACASLKSLISNDNDPFTA